MSKTPKTFITEVYRKVDGVPVAKGTRLTVEPKAKETINLVDGIISKDYYELHYGIAEVEPDPTPVVEQPPTEEVN